MCINKNPIRIISFLCFVLCIVSCDNAVDNSNRNFEMIINYKNLQIGIINTDSKLVKSEIDKLVIGLVPVKNQSDKIGHKENLTLLIDRINELYNNINAELLCYACIETAPPQSEILVATDSADVKIKRVIDISTPADGNLSYVRIHKYYTE